MISSLKIKNCQSHKSSEFNFHNGLNVLVGDTDSGKSAIIRSLDKLIFNSFPTKELRSHWGGSVLIEAVVDGNVVSLKNKTKDEYHVNQLKLAAPGTKVPEEVQNIFNMDDINLQNQIDFFFLLNETSGYVASYLNKIANIEQIDTTTKAIRSKLNETRRTIEHDKDTIKNKEKELEGYAFLSDFESSLNAAEKLQDEKELVDIKLNLMEQWFAQYAEVERSTAEIKPLLALKSKIDQAISLSEQLSEVQQEIKKIKTSLTNLKKIDSKQKNIDNVLRIKPMLDELEKIENNKDELDAKLDVLSSYLIKVSTLDKELKLAIAKRETEHKKYHSKLSELGTCFYCGSKLN